jgi:hypothetical protein
VQRAASAQAAELKARLANQFWRLNNLYKIIGKDGRLITFKMNWAQEALYQDVHFLNVILKARQLGFTTFLQLFMLDECLFNSHTRCGTIADNLDNAKSIFKDKIKSPYDNLPDALREKVGKVDDNALELSLSNNSRIRVGTSLRGGTFNFMHVSELGKIAAKYPEKAREIRTGAFNTVQAGQVIFVESTAEGQEGDFYDMCQIAQSKARMGTRLTELDFKFHFYPWWKEPAYWIDPEGVIISAEQQRKFDELEAKEGIRLNPGQKAWWVKKHETQQEDMGREYPSTPEEAFAASVEGAYYGAQMAKAEAQGRIGTFKALEGLPVHTAWDIGRSDATSIWFYQVLHGQIRVVGFYENSGEAMPHYADKVKELYAANGWTRTEDSRDWFPHDGKVEEWGTGKTRLESAIEKGLQPKIPKAMGLHDGIDAVRKDLAICVFDLEGCAEGLTILRNYRKAWHEERKMWSNEPFHNWASHGADAFRTLSVACRDPGPEKAEKSKQELERQAREERLRELAQRTEKRRGR